MLPNFLIPNHTKEDIQRQIQEDIRKSKYLLDKFCKKHKLEISASLEITPMGIIPRVNVLPKSIVEKINLLNQARSNTDINKPPIEFQSPPQKPQV